MTIVSSLRSVTCPTPPPKKNGKIYQSRHSLYFLSNLTLNKGIGYPHDKIATVEPPEIYALAGLVMAVVHRL